MCLLAMPSEGIEEHKRAKGIQQLCSQMGIVHMRTDSGKGGGGSLRAPLDPAALDQVCVPYNEL